MIWRYVANTLRNLDVWIQHPTPSPGQINQFDELTTTQPIPSILLVNSESRAVGLKHYQQVPFQSGVSGDNNLPLQLIYSRIWLNAERDRICPMGHFSSIMYNELLEAHRTPFLAINAYIGRAANDAHNLLYIPWMFDAISAHNYLREILLYYCEEQFLAPEMFEFVDIDPSSDSRTNGGARKALVHAKEVITSDFRHRAILRQIHVEDSGLQFSESDARLISRFPRIRYVALVVGGVRCDGRYHRFQGLRDTIRDWKNRALGNLRGRRR